MKKYLKKYHNHIYGVASIIGLAIAIITLLPSKKVSSTVEISMKEIDDLGFLGISRSSGTHEIIVDCEFKFPKNGNRTATVQDKIPHGTSLLAIGLYNYKLASLGGKYQYEFNLKIDDKTIISESSNGKIKDKSEGIKYFKVFELHKDNNNHIEYSEIKNNITIENLKGSYSELIQSKETDDE